MTAAFIQARTVGNLAEKFGIKITEISQGLLRAHLDIETWMGAGHGYLHAGTVVTLADSGCGYACIAHLPNGARGFTTLELKSNFLGTARKGRIHCECRADHLGKTTQIWSAAVSDDSGGRLALFRCTQIILT